MDSTKVRLIVIPAHMGSKRLPNKPLLVANGKPLIQYVYERATQVKRSTVAVATDSTQIIEAVKAFGGNAVYTEPTFAGTNRAEQVVSASKKKVVDSIESVVSWQCDEPLVEPEWVDRLFDLLTAEPVEIATIVAPLHVRDEYNPNVVKTVVGTGLCHWFSRNYIQHAYAHIGVYGFTVSTLKKIGLLPPTFLSQSCGLEQLAWVENGFKIYKIDVKKSPLSINTQEDWNQFEEKQACPSKL